MICKSYRFYVLILLWVYLLNGVASIDDEASTTQPTLNSKECDSSWYQFKDSCFKVFRNEEYYSDAGKICQSHNAALTSILNAEENSYINDLISKFTPYDEGWIGLRGNSGGYEWIDKMDFVYNRWMLGKPSSDKGSCVEMVPDGYWNNINCFNRIPFVCKKDKNPPVVESQLGLVLNISIPLSCVFIMFCFVAFLCYKSYKELEEIQRDNVDGGKPFELVQAAMILPLKKAPDLLTSNGKNLWKTAIEKLKEEQIKNNPLNQPSTFLSRGSSDSFASIVDKVRDSTRNRANNSNGSLASIVQNVMNNNNKPKEKEYLDGTLGLPIITYPNVPSIRLNKYSVSDTEAGQKSEDKYRVQKTQQQQQLESKWIELKENSATLQSNGNAVNHKVEVVVELNRPNKRHSFGDIIANGDVITNDNSLTSPKHQPSCDESLSKNQFRESLRRESLRRKHKYFPNSPEKKNGDSFPAYKASAADYKTITLV